MIKPAKTERNSEDIRVALLNVMADLKEVNARNEAILESMADGVIVVDRAGMIILMNQSAEKLLGWTVREAIGKKWFQVLKRQGENGKPIPPKEGAFKNALIGRMTTRTALTEPYFYLRKDGSKFPVARTVSPIIIGDKIIGAVNVFHDMTREKEVDRMKTEFVSLASHQLRTPLTSIKWNLELILDKSAGKLAKEQEKHLKEASRANETMILLVNSLLNISRIESGRLSIEPKLTNLAALFRGEAVKYEQQITKAKLKLIDKIPDNLDKLSVDPRLVANVYSNLINNSIKYTASGGVIEIKIEKKGPFLISEVKDSGIGIPEKQKQHIFEKFFRGSNVSAAGTGSTGLGLYLAKEIVEALGGRIWFESVEKKGSTFYFSLPLKGSPSQKGEVTLSE